MPPPSRTGLTFWETVGFSALVFAGSVQFAAVQILGDGGSVASATIAGLLLGVRSLAFGIIMAPVLTGSWPKRLLMSHVVLDESIAVGAVQPTRHWQRYGFLLTGVGVYVVWNICTVIGFLVFSGAEELITDLGLDTAGPAAILALLWPRLSSAPQRHTAIAAAIIALALTPYTPAGVPILLSMFGVAAALLPTSRLLRAMTAASAAGTESTDHRDRRWRVRHERGDGGARCCSPSARSPSSPPDRCSSAPARYRPGVQNLVDLLPAALARGARRGVDVRRGQSLVLDARAAGMVVACVALWRRVPFVFVILLASAATALVRQIA